MTELKLTEKSVLPNHQMLVELLGETFSCWEEIRKHLAETYGSLTEEWKYYGAKNGWTLKMLYKKRNLFFFKPYDNYFVVSFIFGDKAVSAVCKSDLPKKMIQEITNAKKYAEGRGLRVEVKTQKAVAHIVKLIAIKMEN